MGMYGYDKYLQQTTAKKKQIWNHILLCIHMKSYFYFFLFILNVLFFFEYLFSCSAALNIKLNVRRFCIIMKYSHTNKLENQLIMLS